MTLRVQPSARTRRTSPVKVTSVIATSLLSTTYQLVVSAVPQEALLLDTGVYLPEDRLPFFQIPFSARYW